MIIGTGIFNCRLDDRGRLRIPAEIVSNHAEDGKGHFVLRKGFDNCLVLYPMSTWKIDFDRVNALDDMIPNQRKFKRMFFTSSKSVKVDSNGRVQLPTFLASSAGIDRDVVILGLSDRYEIWDTKNYADEQASDGDMNALALEIFGTKND